MSTSSASRLINVYARCATTFWSGAQKAWAQSNSALAIENAAMTMRSQLLIALVKWRHCIADPRAELARCLTTARTAHVWSEQAPAYRDQFPFGPACYVSFLADRHFDDSLVRDLGSPESWDALTKRDWEVALDASLIASLQSDGDISLSKHLVEAVSAQRRLVLLARSFKAYDRIIRAGARRDLPILQEHIRQAESLFLQRQRSSYYAGGSETEGGGRSNAHVVDYRLAVVVNWCEEKVRRRIETIHRIPEPGEVIPSTREAKTRGAARTRVRKKRRAKTTKAPRR
jgi:hypothetical protein